MGALVGCMGEKHAWMAADCFAIGRGGDGGPHVVSVGYLALTRRPESADALRATGAGFTPWYRFFPWEDWRTGRPEILDRTILPALERWAQRETRDDPPRPLGRRERLRPGFAAGRRRGGGEEGRRARRVVVGGRARGGAPPGRQEGGAGGGRFPRGGGADAAR